MGLEKIRGREVKIPGREVHRTGENINCIDLCPTNKKNWFAPMTSGGRVVQRSCRAACSSLRTSCCVWRTRSTGGTFWLGRGPRSFSTETTRRVPVVSCTLALSLWPLSSCGRLEKQCYWCLNFFCIFETRGLFDEATKENFVKFLNLFVIRNCIVTCKSKARYARIVFWFVRGQFK